MVGVLGLVAFILAPNLQPELAFPYLVNHILPVGVKGLVISGLLAVLMSSADSFLHVAGLLFTHDVIKPLQRREMSDKAELRMARIVTATVIGTISVFAAMVTTSLIELNILGYVFWMPAICVPLLSAIMGRPGSVFSLLVSGAFGISTFLIWRFNFYELTHIDSLLPALLMSALVFFVVCFIENRAKRGAKLSGITPNPPAIIPLQNFLRHLNFKIAKK